MNRPYDELEVPSWLAYPWAAIGILGALGLLMLYLRLRRSGVDKSEMLRSLVPRFHLYAAAASVPALFLPEYPPIGDPVLEHRRHILVIVMKVMFGVVILGNLYYAVKKRS